MVSTNYVEIDVLVDLTLTPAAAANSQGHG